MFHKNLVGGGWNERFHRYQLEWSPQALTFSVDDAVIGKVEVADGFWARGDFANRTPGTLNPWRYAGIDAPFDQEFFIIINLAVGGNNFFPDNTVSCVRNQLEVILNPFIISD